MVEKEPYMNLKNDSVEKEYKFFITKIVQIFNVLPKVGGWMKY